MSSASTSNSAAVPPSPGGEAGASPAGVGAGAPTFSPLYQQIKTLILQSLQAGEWKPGEMIPSEMELAARYKVSQGTVRKAIDELAAENLVARRQGKGTFVTTHYEEGVQFRFLRLMPEQGEQHYPSSRVLECKRLRAPAEIARLLDLKPGDSVVQIRRVLFFSGEPTVFEEIWLPGSSFKGLTAEKLTDWKGPMYAFLRPSSVCACCVPPSASAPWPRMRARPGCCRWRRVRRCCRSSGCRTRLVTSRWSCVAACMSRRGTITRMN